jgi:DNA-binding transcriptional LysR family regulator
VLLRNLGYFDALAREQHFARAAAACQVTQPTLSAGIKQLEVELGLLVVQRGQRFEGLTPEGVRILDWARRILSDCQSLQQVASELRSGLVGRLRIGAIPTTLPAIALLTSPFIARHPQVTVSVLSMTSIDIQRGLDDFSLDAGLTYLDNEPLSHVRTIPLYRERYFLFTPADGPLARQPTVSWREAASVPLCLLTPDMQNRRLIDSFFTSAGIEIHPPVETNSTLTLWSHLRTGRWSTVLPQPFLFLFGRPEGIRAVPLDAPQRSPTIGLVVPDREPLTPSSRELAQLVEELDVASALEHVATD